MSEPVRDISAELVAVYSEHVSTIQSIKTSQWNLANYSALAYAALIAVPADNLALGHRVFWASVLAAAMVWAAGKLLYGLKGRRERLIGARSLLLPKAGIEAYGDTKEEPSLWQDGALAIAPFVIQLVGVYLVCVWCYG